MAISKIKLPDNSVQDLHDARGVDTNGSFYYVAGSSSAAGSSTSGAYLSTKWEGTVPGVSAAYNGLKIAYRIATRTGVSGGGVVLSIDNGAHYYPVVIQKNTMVTTHYPVGATFLAVFNSTQTATAYLTAGTKSTVTGCWQIMEYDSNTNTYQREYVSTDDTEYPVTARYNTTTGETYYAEYGRYSEGITLNPSKNSITASKFIVANGTSSQFLKADGSVDSNSYALTSAIPDVSGLVSKSGDEMEPNAELLFPMYEDNDIILSTTVSMDGVLVTDTQEESGINLTIDGLYVASDHLDGKHTQYARGEIYNSNSAGNTEYTLTLPEATGTIALTSDIPSVPVTDVTVGGSSVVSSGTAVVPAIPDAVEANPTVPSGTTPTTLQNVKVGNNYYSVSSASALNDLTDVNAGSPSDGDVLTYDNATGKWVADAPSGGEISTNIVADKADNAKSAGTKAVYDFVKPASQNTMPAGGLLPGVLYNLGALTGTVTIDLATPADASVANEYAFTFYTSTTAPTITWPSGILGWAGNCIENYAPSIKASKFYEVSILNGIGAIMEVEV